MLGTRNTVKIAAQNKVAADIEGDQNVLDEQNITNTDDWTLHVSGNENAIITTSATDIGVVGDKNVLSAAGPDLHVKGTGNVVVAPNAAVNIIGDKNVVKGIGGAVIRADDIDIKGDQNVVNACDLTLKIMGTDNTVTNGGTAADIEIEGDRNVLNSGIFRLRVIGSNDTIDTLGWSIGVVDIGVDVQKVSYDPVIYDFNLHDINGAVSNAHLDLRAINSICGSNRDFRNDSSQGHLIGGIIIYSNGCRAF
jgi:hypothetical protein